jgi:hypothetical protein
VLPTGSRVPPGPLNPTASSCHAQRCLSCRAKRQWMTFLCLRLKRQAMNAAASLAYEIEPHTENHSTHFVSINNLCQVKLALCQMLVTADKQENIKGALQAIKVRGVQLQPAWQPTMGGLRYVMSAGCRPSGALSWR